MNKVDILFIRAAVAECADNLKRVRKVYMRFYLGSQVPANYRDAYIAEILIDICDKYMPISTSNLVNALNPAHDSMKGITEYDQYYTKVCKVLISHIRQQPIGSLPNFRFSIKYRNN